MMDNNMSRNVETIVIHKPRRRKDIYDYEPPYNNVETAGLVGLFEICFEQAWKAVKEYLLDQGYKDGSTGFPKQILKTAYEYGLIEGISLSVVRKTEKRINRIKTLGY